MTTSETPLVGIIMGSESDMPTMEACMKQLDELGISYEVKVASAHRKPACLLYTSFGIAIVACVIGVALMAAYYIKRERML